MIKKIIGFVVLFVFVFSIVSCVAVKPVHNPPPPARKEFKTPRPGPNYIWVRGHHEWRHGHWHWVQGHWTKKKRGKVWVPGHWEKRPKGWVWVKGHWRRR